MTRRLFVSTFAAALTIASLGACAKNGSCCDDKDKGEVAVTMSDLPPAVQATLARESAGGKVTEIEKEMKNGKTVYSADVEINGKTWDIAIADDGSVIEKKAE